jgi:O-Antigen ligase
MTAALLCILALIATYLAGRRSLGVGLIGLFTFGYFYGIIRANMPVAASHFIFDAALLGLYASQKWSGVKNSTRSGGLSAWLLLLGLWPALIIFMPFQPLLVSLVGFRGAVFFLPMALFGSRMKERDLYQLSMGLSALNLAVLAFAGAEYFLGIERFFPLNAVTALIYGSADVAGGFNRIPATFVTAHAYGGSMVASLPFLIGIWDQAQQRLVRLTAVVGIAAAFLGILLSATRVNFVLSAALVFVAIFNPRMKASRRAIFLVFIVGMMALALSNERLQRFKTLSDSDSVEERIAGSVNRGFFEILIEYPMGNGLGGGGTSMPYFLQGQVRNPVSMENEYARILSEQGIIGLVLWLGFIVWFLSRSRQILTKGRWATCRRLIWVTSVTGLISGVIGTGMLTSIPATAILLLGMGFLASPAPAEEPEGRRTVGVKQTVLAPGLYQPVPALRSEI